VRPAHRHFCGSLGSGCAGSLRAFTLLELLVTVSIIALLIAILGTTLGKVRDAGRDFVCKNKKKTVAFEFFQFADDYAHPYRGDSDKLNGKFMIHDFQERLYGLAEFWKKKSTPGLAYDPSKQPLMCPSAPGQLSRVSEDLPCGEAAFDHWSNVSTAFNLRLLIKPVRIRGSMYIPGQAILSRRIMDKPMVPLAFDVNGEEAAAVAKSIDDDEYGPLYGTPLFEGKGETYPFYRDRWYPKMRHNNRLNVAFVGGHVLSSGDPAHGSGWKWRYLPD